MESPNNLEIKGGLSTNPLAELLREIARNNFDGSLRLLNEARKTVFYFDGGKLIFVASNARQHRLFESLLRAEKITQPQLLAIPDFTNDLALKDNLLANGLFDKDEIDALFKQQINVILRDAVGWETGEWIFSPLVRVKNHLHFEIEINALLLNFARGASAEKVVHKFRNSEERLTPSAPPPGGVDLSPHEWFVFSRFENAALTCREIQNSSGLPESELLRIIYCLWLGGFINREDNYSAFSERYVAAIAASRLTAVKDSTPVPIVKVPTAETAPPVRETSADQTAPPIEETASDRPISLEEYFARIEAAENYYDFFALPPDAPTADVKKAYFGLAKRFHPDLYRRETDPTVHGRVQSAFTKVAHAYDTLKDESLREVYDFKIRKEIAEMVERQKSGATVEEIREVVEAEVKIDQAAESFNHGFNLLMDDEYEAAVPHLARAVFFEKNNARYHAYYGKALAADAHQSHRAEAALQTAVKLDNENADYRIMLAEFFIGIGFVKRAEGELNRLLTIAPNNPDARTLLNSLKRK